MAGKDKVDGRGASAQLVVAFEPCRHIGDEGAGRILPVASKKVCAIGAEDGRTARCVDCDRLEPRRVAGGESSSMPGAIAASPATAVTRPNSRSRARSRFACPSLHLAKAGRFAMGLWNQKSISLCWTKNRASGKVCEKRSTHPAWSTWRCVRTTFLILAAKPPTRSNRTTGSSKLASFLSSARATRIPASTTITSSVP